MSKQAKRLGCCLDLMRRMPPQNVEKNLSDLIDIAPESLLEDLLATVDQPLKVAICKETQREYLLCDYNRDGDSYRSPWSNTYDPSFPTGTKPSPRLRELEISANNAFNRYRELYFEGGISSVYIWDMEEDGFAGVVLIKKSGEGSRKIQGCWDSIHVFEVSEKKQGQSIKCSLKLTSNILLWLQNNTEKGSLNLSGNLTRQSSMSAVVTKENTHIEFIGRMVEDMENKMRHVMVGVYFGKIKDISASLRSDKSLVDLAKWGDVTKDLAQKISQKPIIS